MIPIVRQLAGIIRNVPANATKSGVPDPTLRSWFKKRRTPRIDLFIAAAEAEGYEVILRRKTMPKIIDRNDRVEVFERNELIAYVEEETLFKIVKGYAEPIGRVNHRSEIIGKLTEHA